MSSIREQILAQVITNLKAITGVTASKVVRTRIKPVEESDYPYISLEPVSDSPEANDLGFIKWDLAVKIVLYEKGTVPDSVADALLTKIKDKMLADRTISTLAADVFPGPISWNFQLGNKDCVEIESIYLIKYIEVG